MFRFLIVTSFVVAALAGPASAQQKATAPTDLVREIESLVRLKTESLMKRDADALAALFVDGAVYATSSGDMLFGREKIRDYYAKTIPALGDTFTRESKIDEVHELGAGVWALGHGKTYAVFDVLQVPVWGREDDAADRLAAFVLLQFSGEIAHTTMVGSAEFFLLSLRTWTGSAFADTASPEGQRFYNFLCIAYGGDSNDFGGWTEAPDGQDPLLPQRRAQQCSHEYQQVRAAFNLRIMPYIDPDLLLQIKAAEWFLPGELSK